MPTINQLVRQGRKSISTKSDSPAEENTTKSDDCSYESTAANCENSSR